MPYLAQLAQWLWIPSTAAQAALIYFMLRHRLRGEFTVFFHYTVFQVLSTVAMYPLYRYAWNTAGYATYFYAYWATVAVSSFLGFGVIYEVFKNAFKPFMALRDFAGIMFRWATLVLLLVAAILAFSTSSAPNGRLITAILSLERSVLVMQAGMLLFLMLFSSRLGLTWKHHSFGISLGFGIYASGQLVISTLFAQLGTSFGEAYTLLQSVLYTAMTTIWLVYLASPEPARVALESAFAPKPVLERWNDVLLRRSLQPQSAFLTNLERIVDDVMTRSE